MLVETYEVPEVDVEGQVECDAEAIALIESLGLEGQQKLLRKNEEDDSATTRCPYRKMTKEEAFAYKQLCPEVTSLHKYADGPIPLRVLQVAAHGKEFFQKLEVWHPKNADEKDPILVGINSSGNTTERFILARWGEVLEPLSDCLAEAVLKFRATYKAAIVRAKNELDVGLASIDEMPVEQLIDRGERSMPWVYGV